MTEPPADSALVNAAGRRRRFQGFVLAVVALAVYALVWPALTVWSLDIEALVHNTYLDWTTDYAQRWYARRSWIPGLQLIFKLSLCGLTMLVGTTLVLRFLALVLRRRDLEPFASPRARRLALCVGLAFFLPGSFPMALALAMGVAIELYPWIEWHRGVDPMMEAVHGPGLWMILASLLPLGGLVLLWVASPRESRLRRPFTPAGPRWLLLWLFLGLILAPALLSLVPTTARALRAAPSLEGSVVFERECDACHERALPLYYVKSPSEWTETISTHRRVEGVALTDEEASALHAVLSGTRAFSDAWTFRTRCQNCHGSSWRRWERREAEDWEAITERLSRWSPYYYSAPTREQLTTYLVREKRAEQQTFGLSQERFEALNKTYKECDDCHSVSYEAGRYAEASESEVRSMIERMGQKLAEPYAEAQLDELTEAYIDLLSSAERFDRIFPHDRPEHSGGGL
ncbi:MAG: hypothetical protein VX498_03465 [Myxococcota bacterium]|nr:hypothetical protein [Myxococcota bacterium]